MFPLTELSVLDYFSLSQFYDRTCTNEQLRMQTRFTTAVGTIRLEEMVGVEYVVAETKQPPRLFIIHKRHRHSPHDFDVLASYYVLDGTIYQAPTLLSLLRCRVTTSLAFLTEAIQMGADNLRYEPNLKAYSVKGEHDMEVTVPSRGETDNLRRAAIEDRTVRAFIKNDF